MPEDRNILVRVPNWIGDAVLATGFLSSLRRTAPQARITVLAHERVSAIFECHPAVEAIIKFNSREALPAIARRIREQKYDCCYLLPLSFSSALIAWLAGITKRVGYASECRGFLLTRRLAYNAKEFRSRHLLLGYLRLIGRDGEPSDPAIILNREESEWWPQGLGDRRIEKPIIGFGPGATYGPSKRWPGERWVELGRRLIGKGYRILIFGSSAEAELCNYISQGLGDKAFSLAGGTNLRQSAALLRQCQFFITNDTGVMHFAAAVGTKVVAIFGSTNPDWTRPWGEGHQVIYKREPCSPCYQRNCRYGHYRCLQSIGLEDVMEAIDKIVQIR